MHHDRFPETYFVGTLTPLGEGLYRLSGPLSGELRQVEPPASQELRVYLEPKDTLRRSPAMID